MGSRPVTASSPKDSVKRTAARAADVPTRRHPPPAPVMETLARTASHPDVFADRHLGLSDAERDEMLELVGFDSLDALGAAAVPAGIQLGRDLDLPDAMSETELLAELAALAELNETARSYIGMGYHGTILPPVIQRNVLENPGWYTQYTPYQAEIAQGRLEALLNFQTVVSDLTGLPVANASLLDEGTAAAEAMSMFAGAHRGKRSGSPWTTGATPRPSPSSRCGPSRSASPSRSRTSRTTPPATT